MAEKELIKLIDRWSDEIVGFVSQLVATPSETPPGDEREICRLLLHALERLGLQGAAVASEIPERPNIVYRLKGTGHGITLLYVAHTDTKPVGDVRDQWLTDPFEASINDGRLYGLGA